MCLSKNTWEIFEATQNARLRNIGGGDAILVEFTSVVVRWLIPSSLLSVIPDHASLLGDFLLVATLILSALALFFDLGGQELAVVAVVDEI